MKIKNLSSQNLNLSLTKGSGEKTIISLKPNQVLYADNNSDINKQLLIYEKKKLVYVNREMDKPSYVDYYKPFFESATSSTQNSGSYVDLDDDDEDDDVDVLIDGIDSIGSNFTDEDDEFDGEMAPVKKGRGRPKGTSKKEPKTQSEKKGRGRPKGTTKSKIESSEESESIQNSEQKRGRGRPKGTVKTNNQINGVEEHSEQQKKRGRPKGTIKLKVIQQNSDTLKKRGRGRPKGSLNIKNTQDTTEIVLKRKRGRPRKFQFDN